jgi:hypothetical protein
METATHPPRLCTAFEGTRLLAAGDLREVALKLKALSDRGPRHGLLVFDDSTGRLVDLDLRGSSAEVLARLPTPAAAPSEGEATDGPRGPGRPRLGVVAREVTLLPRHWDWLAGQPGGASAALRRLVETGRRDQAGQDRVRIAQEAAYRIMTALAGDAPGYEEATRALFAGQRERFAQLTVGWPPDVGAHVRRLAEAAFPPIG